jgi:diguanylate cyclase
MPHTDLAGACIFAERLRAQVESKLTITVSGGVATAQEGDTQESLIARTDAALYSAKSAGRNRVFRSVGASTELVPAEVIAMVNTP